MSLPSSALSFVLGSLFVLAGAAAEAAPKREIVVANEHLAVVDPAYLAESVELFCRRVEEVTGWPKGSVTGKAFSRPREALDYITKNKVAFAILPTHQFVEGRKALKLEVLGRAVGFEGATVNYWGVMRKGTRSFSQLQERPGLTLAMTETYDLQWIRVLFEAEVKPETHFKLLEVPTDKAAIEAVLQKKADLAMLYERDFQTIKKQVENKVDLEWVYTSGGLPPPPIVAVGKFAAKADRKRFTEAIGKMCKDPGGPACSRMGVVYMQPGMADTYKHIINKYETY